MRIGISYAYLMALSLAFVPGVRAQNVVTIDYPGAIYTEVRQINDNGVMVGRYIDTSNVIHAFTLTNGVFQNIDVPGQPVSAGWGINNLGQIVGRYFDGHTDHGFLLSGGTYTTIDPPGTTDTFALGINDAGQIVGFYVDSTGFEHGFLLSAGLYKTLDVPGSTYDEVVKVNNAGTMVGDYGDADGNNRGFVYSNGVFRTVDFPQAFYSELLGLNSGGELAGGYQETATSNEVGFTDVNGVFTTINFPAAVDGLYIDDINDAEQLVGVYFDANDVGHAFVSVKGPVAYMTNNGSDNVSVVDTNSQLIASAVPIGAKSELDAVTPDGAFVYVTDDSNQVLVIATASNTVVATIPVAAFPTFIAISPNGLFAYVSIAGGNVVDVVNTANNSVVATIPAGSFPDGVAFTPDGSFAYVANEGTNNISVIQTSTNAVVATIPVSIAPVQVAILPTGSFAYVSSQLGSVDVINIATNAVVATVPVGGSLTGIVISPDGESAYVASSSANTISVINTATNSVIATVPVGHGPEFPAITPDGATLYVPNYFDGTLSVINTATRTVIATIPVGNNPRGIAVAAAAPTTQKVTQPLSPTQPNQFNFGPHNFTVQYPPGTSFSNVNMTVAAAQTSGATFAQRVAGTAFANATCIVYSGSGGNCVDYQVTCTNTSGGAIACPSEPTASINVKTSYDTLQTIINPGFLTAPIGTNQWQNIFTAFYLQRIDPTTRGRTSAFSEFFAVDLGTSNEQGAGTLQFEAPLLASDSRVFPAGTTIPVKFQLSSIANPGTFVTDAVAGIAVVMVEDGNGNPVSNVVLEKSAAFTYGGGSYSYQLNTTGYAPGTYNVTLYGNAFAAQQVQFTLPAPMTGAHLVTTLQSLTLNTSINQYVVVLGFSNPGTAAAGGLVVTSAQLNSTATGTALPLSIGDLGSGATATAALTFPASAGAPASRGVLSVSLSYAGGTAGAGFRVTLP